MRIHSQKETKEREREFQVPGVTLISRGTHVTCPREKTNGGYTE